MSLDETFAYSVRSLDNEIVSFLSGKTNERRKDSYKT